MSPSSSLAVARGSREVARPLHVLKPVIQTAIDNGHAAGTAYFREAGVALREAKDQIGSSSQFDDWIKRSFRNFYGKPLSRATAEQWMAFSATKSDPKKPFKSLDDWRRRELGEAVETGSKRNRKLFGGAKKVLEDVAKTYTTLRQSQMSQAREREVQRALNLQLIDIGYKILAIKLHPDKQGGSQEAMSRLNRGRDHLKLHA